MDRNQLYPLEKVKPMVDLGVCFDSNFTFRDHVSEKINKAYSVLGIISASLSINVVSVSANGIDLSPIPSVGL